MNNPITGHARMSGAWIEADTIEGFKAAEAVADETHTLLVALLDADAPAKEVPHLDVWAAAVILACVENRPVAVRKLGVAVPDPIALFIDA